MTYEDHEHEDPTTIVDDDGHTLADITPMEIDEPDDCDTAVNNPEDPDEYLNWDRERDGYMSDYASDDLPEILYGDACEKGC